MKFPNLTGAERAMLWYADVDNIGRDEIAAGGPSDDPADASNDPKGAAEWSHDRDIRASLIRWLAVDRAAAERIDPKGLRVLGARIVGPLDLSGVRVSFPISLIRCSISEVMNFNSAEIPSLDLSGSATAGLNGSGLNAHAALNLGTDARSDGGFRASGVVDLSLAKADVFLFQGGHFHFSAVPNPALGDPVLKIALILFGLESKSDVSLCCGFQSEGAVLMDESNIGGDLNCSGGHFFNPNNVALSDGTATISGEFIAGTHPYGFSGTGEFEADGLVTLWGTRVGNLDIQHAKFRGKTGEKHGLSAPALSARGRFIWQHVQLENGAVLDLSGAEVSALLDDQDSWPQRGSLFIDGLTYQTLSGTNTLYPTLKSPTDANSRLKWIALQSGFHPQPYRQLAKVLRERGDDQGAVTVLIAKDDERYSQYGFAGRLWGGFLKWTIGYGHRPLLALLWSLAVVLIGSAVVLVGKRAGVMRLTWPETTPPPSTENVTGLHPLLYSLDVFLPFVNLHQEHYWWPDEAASGRCKLVGQQFRVDGRMLRYYLWLQIIAGWLLSAIFIAGVTGLIRND